jgi:hypothetical protein
MFALRRAAVAPAAKLVRLAKTTGKKHKYNTSYFLACKGVDSMSV